MRTLLKLGASLVACVGLVGVMHMPFARSFLQRVGGCPFPSSGRSLTAAESEALRVATLRRDAGKQASATRDALGFALGETQRSEITRWAAQHALRCKPDRHGAGVRCDAVRGEMLPFARAAGAPFSALFAFDTHDRLVGVQLQSREPSAAGALARSTVAAQRIVAAGGEPLSDVAQLARPLGQARAELRASNYAADLVITHLGDHYALYESYQAL